jgi:hypothetical protein
MRHFFPVLAVLAGLGSSISFARFVPCISCFATLFAHFGADRWMCVHIPFDRLF